jgi:para-aminobenzoate synthetase component 1
VADRLTWVEPLQAAAQAAIRESYWALLYSGQHLSYTGRYSYLCLFPRDTLTGSHFSSLEGFLSNDKDTLENAWVGWFGYEMLHVLERFTESSPSFITLPRSCFTRFGMVIRFDHETRTVFCHRDPHLTLPEWLQNASSVPDAKPALVKHITSPMNRERYVQAVKDTKEAIARGDFYQANITRKFTGEFTSPPQAFDVFRTLCTASPAAYSAFIQYHDTAIVSSSPERFVTVDAAGHMESRPIKGTAPRLQGQEDDQQQRERLHVSEKDRAENLMIVDLMRNDLARGCEAGSIQVDNLFEVTSYATLHHMASTVSGKKQREVSTLKALQYCFPPGSMTGAPKIAAMRWCMQQEQLQRGIYSGALGWFGGDGSCDFSVVIRTLVIQGNRFEFQVGGGIISDSDPEAEWRETITKARGIMQALGLDASVLEKI